MILTSVKAVSTAFTLFVKLLSIFCVPLSISGLSFVLFCQSTVLSIGTIFRQGFLLNDRVGCSGGLILNPSSVQQTGIVTPWRGDFCFLA